MKAKIITLKREVEHELKATHSGKPFIKENIINEEHFYYNEVNMEMIPSIGEKLYLNEEECGTVKKIDNILGKMLTIYLDYVSVKTFDEDEYKLIEKMYKNRMKKYARSLREKHPDYINLMKLSNMNPDSDEDFVKYVKAFQGVLSNYVNFT